MMARRKSRTSEAPPEKSDLSFVELMLQVPKGVFVSMVSRSGLPAHEARALCQAFQELKKP